MDDINQISKGLEQDEICLDPKDEISMKLWLDILREEGANTFCKDKLDLPLSGSQLAADLFILFLQTKFQSDTF